VVWRTARAWRFWPVVSPAPARLLGRRIVSAPSGLLAWDAGHSHGGLPPPFPLAPPISPRAEPFPGCLPGCPGASAVGAGAIALRRYSGAAMEYIVRQARTRDVPEIRSLIDQNVGSRRLLEKHTVNLYEDILEFSVSESSSGGVVVGCGALHVLWEDLAELRTVAVDESRRGEGIGHLIVDDLLDRARRVGVSRVFVLTFAVSFFGRHGFTEISGTPVAPEVYAELLRSYDDGVAEFLDLDRVKPNTLGNTRMLLRLLEIHR
jgi:amino-acid N-acetyltransferase